MRDRCRRSMPPGSPPLVAICRSVGPLLYSGVPACGLIATPTNRDRRRRREPESRRHYRRAGDGELDSSTCQCASSLESSPTSGAICAMHERYSARRWGYVRFHPELPAEAEQLEGFRGPHGMPVERDTRWQPKSLALCRQGEASPETPYRPSRLPGPIMCPSSGRVGSCQTWCRPWA